MSHNERHETVMGWPSNDARQSFLITPVMSIRIAEHRFLCTHAPCGTLNMFSLSVHLWGVDPHPFADLAIKDYKSSRTAECFRW